MSELLKARAGEKLIFDHPSVLSEAVTHYCPGCHHGIAHRLVAEVLEELELASRAIMVASVGCSVISYDYISVDSVESPHGRACAVATGVKRARPDTIVFTYQGDGDMGAIGLAESLHAAARGEHITAVFVNNTVYGMTGGQMAPTTLLGQKTTTTPMGRRMELEGGPVHMAEMMSQLAGVAYAERCSLDSVRHIRAAQDAIRKAFSIQAKGLGFSFVELLSGCPTNWHMDPVRANTRIREEMIPVFPLGVYKDITAQAVPVIADKVVEGRS